MKIGEVLNNWRRIQGIGVREAGVEIGISHGTVSRIERGEQIDAATMMKLLRWLFDETGARNGRKERGK